MLTNLAIVKAFAAFKQHLNLEDICGLILPVSDEGFKFFNEFFEGMDPSKYDGKALELLSAAWIELRKSPPIVPPTNSV